ncbi:MAG: cobalt ECF transporter T component CbiQ [Methanocellales archaeon]
MIFSKEIERETFKNSMLHKLEGRVKIAGAFAIIIYAVVTKDILKLLAVECYLIALALLAKLRLDLLGRRLLLILPFGGIIAFFQLFFKKGSVLYSLPLGITITSEGLTYSALLFSKIVVCITSVILLSSLSPMHELIASAKRLGVPREVILLLGLFSRYLFVFQDVYQRIKIAQKTRCFQITNRKVPYTWILEQLSYSISSLFIRAYEQGERTYISMLSRGYNPNSEIYIERRNITLRDCLYLINIIGTLIAIQYFI